MWRIQTVVVLALIAVAGLPALLLPEVFIELANNLASPALSSIWILGGLAGGTGIRALLGLGQRGRFLSTLQHESSHLTVGLFLGAIPRSLVARGQRGHVEMELAGPLRASRRFLIAIAPYWFSPLFPAALRGAMAEAGRSGLELGLAAGAMGMALALPLSQVHQHQEDLKAYGYLAPLGAALWLWSALAVVGSKYSRRDRSPPSGWPTDRAG